MRFRRAIQPVVLSAAVLLGSHSVCWAKDRGPSSEDIKTAAAEFDRGRDAYRSESYIEAAEHFEAADDAAPSAAALRLAFLARAEAGQFSRALTLALLGQELYPDEQELQTEAAQLISEHGDQLAKLNITCDPECNLVLDGKLVHGRAATSRTLYVDPGMHKVRASWEDGRVRNLGASADAGGLETLDFVPPEADAAPEPGDLPPDAAPSNQPGADTPTASSGWSPAVFWTGTALTAIGVGLSTGLGVMTLSEPGPDYARQRCEAGASNCEALVNQGIANQTAASVAIGATAAVGAFTILTGLLWTDWRSASPAQPAAQTKRSQFTWSPTVAVGDGFVLGATGRF
jgi:hypothetical protein